MDSDDPPQSVSRLTKEEMSRVHVWMRKHFIKRGCAICDHDRFSVEPFIFCHQVWGRNALRLGGPVYPVVIITCVQCGHTYQISALVSGIVDRHSDPNQNEDSE